jgi:Xaa-Pro aminopeptidase
LLPEESIRIAREVLAAAAQVAADAGCGTLVAHSDLEVRELGVIRAIAHVDVVDQDPLRELRAVKSPRELESLSRACAITVESLTALIPEIRIGMSEAVIARLLELEFARRGADDRAFPTIVASGPHSAEPHHITSARTLEFGDFLLIDCGAMVNGYHADMTRTFVIGNADPWQRATYELVREAQAAARSVAVPGVDCRDVDAAARNLITHAGMGANFAHGTGHGVGLDIHEAPYLGPSVIGSLTAGMTITIEPGVYLPGRGGVRIEDTLVVTDSAHQVLTEAPRGLQVLEAR